MISGLSQDVTIYEISECNIDFWILQLKSSTLFEETEIYQRTAKIYHGETKICIHDFYPKLVVWYLYLSEVALCNRK